MFTTAAASLTPTSDVQEVKKVDIDFFNELVNSIPAEEKDSVIAELDTNAITARANLLCEELSSNKPVGLNINESRTLLLAALRNLKHKTISVAQLASLHIFDSAVQTLYVNPMVYLIHRYVNANGDICLTYSLHTPAKNGIPTSFCRVGYDAICMPEGNVSLSDLPLRMQKPLMKRFFNFSDSEWNQFCMEMKKAPISEQFFSVLIAPEEGCWSSIIFKIQKALKCMQVLDWWKKSNNGFFTESIMPVPSFSMFQAAINAKACTLARKPVELIPTYGYVEAERYAILKSSGKIAMAMYLPEKNVFERYQSNSGRFRTKVDGHPSETAFAGFIHDVYHAMREMAMLENIAKARMRLAAIAKKHPKNKLTPESQSVDDILVDGELIHSYPPEIDTMFNPEFRANHAESFGELFYVSSLRYDLHEDLKRAFLEDMVVNKKIWQEQFNLGRNDLIKEDQIIFDEIECQVNLSKPVLRTLTTKTESSTAASTYGRLFSSSAVAVTPPMPPKINVEGARAESPSPM